MPIPVPAADANICSGWNEQEMNLYNKLDFYLAKMQVDRRKWFPVWKRFFGKKRWTPNMGATMRSVMKEPSPHIRQFAFPTEISQTPKKDIIDVRERKVDEQIYRHRFESMIMSFVPSFRDFLTDHVDFAGEDIMEKQERYEDIFYRGRAFHRAPYVYISGAANPLEASPYGNGNNLGTNGKTTAWLQQAAAKVGINGNLNFAMLNALVTIAENDLKVPAFKGSGLPKEDAGLNEKWALVCSSEAWNQFTFDPWLLANKNCNLDIVNNRFKGSIFGQITAIIEDKPLRMAADGTFPQPEIRELNPDFYNHGETIPNPTYTGLDTCPFEWAFLVGAQGYDVLEVGPPPSAFASNGMPKGFGKMFWNGEVEITKNFLIPCVQDDGTVTWETNHYGELLKMISQVTYGSVARQPRNIIPILFKRKRGQ